MGSDTRAVTRNFANPQGDVTAAEGSCIPSPDPIASLRALRLRFFLPKPWVILYVCAWLTPALSLADTARCPSPNALTGLEDPDHYVLLPSIDVQTRMPAPCNRCDDPENAAHSGCLVITCWPRTPARAAAVRMTRGSSSSTPYPAVASHCNGISVTSHPQSTLWPWERTADSCCGRSSRPLASRTATAEQIFPTGTRRDEPHNASLIPLLQKIRSDSSSSLH